MQDAATRAFSVKTFCARNEIGRTTAYGEIQAGRLRAYKLGRRTVITIDDEAAWLAALSAIEPKP